MIRQATTDVVEQRHGLTQQQQQQQQAQQQQQQQQQPPVGFQQQPQ